MLTRHARVAFGAALSAAVLASLPSLPARAQQPQRNTNEAARSTEPPTELDQPVAQTPAGEERGLLMDTLDRAGVAEPLEAARVRIFGYVEGSFTYNPDPTEHERLGVLSLGDINLDRTFDTNANEPLLNQINLTAERAVDLNGSQFDVGFRAEVIYGADARFLHANGMNFYGTGVPLGAANYFQEDPKNQFDLFQTYVDLNLPVGNGLGLRVGKFASFFGGTVDPNGNTFYSRSLVFATSHPFTFTGVLARYNVSEDLLVEAGFSRGWDQALEDNNDAIDVLGRVTYIVGDRTSIALAAVTGPEQDDDNGNYRTLVETTLKHQATERLRLILSGTYGQDANIEGIGRDVRWWAVAGYTNYFLTDHVSFNARLEFLRDEKGFVTGLAGNTYSGTLGFTITPFPTDRVGRGLKVRPEVRVDYSDDDRYGGVIDENRDPIVDTDSNTQVTFGVDAIFNF